MLSLFSTYTRLMEQYIYYLFIFTLTAGNIQDWQVPIHAPKFQMSWSIVMLVSYF
jgi:hypothetical protein